MRCQDENSNEKMVWSSCNVNCGSRCPLRVFVRNGRVVRVEPDNTCEDVPGVHEIRACLRGRGLRKWIYSPDRLLHPLKRVGKRGEGAFERVSWDEALDFIAGRLKKTIREFGNESVFRIYGTGNLGGVVSGRNQIDRLMNLLGGYLNYYNSYSTAQITHAIHYTYGENQTGNHISDIANSRLVVFFGNNPAETRMSGGGTVRDLIKAKQAGGARVIVIDPFHTDTVAAFADEWIPIKPGTDAALVGALAYILITEGLIDKEFLDACTVGFDDSTLPPGIPKGSGYRDYILGNGPDNLPKTPEWASAITGVKKERIVTLAREIGQIKPAYIAQGWGPQRQANGEQTARSICMLPILTGNVGVKGGNSGDREGPYVIDFPDMPTGSNPVKTSIPCFLWTRAIEKPQDFRARAHGLKGKERLDSPLKFLWSYASNMVVNQHSDINRTRRILADESLCETILVMDNVMTASARFADIVLPTTSSFEESDLVYQGYAVEMGALMLRQKAIEPLGECRTLYDICAGLAKRFSVAEEFTQGRDHDGWVEHLYHECRKVKPDLPEQYERAVERGLFKWPRPGEPKVAFRDFRENPKAHPLATPSGKIEIFSKTLWDLAREWELPEGDVISALPEFHATWGMPGPKADPRYPLQLVGHHYKQRTHSSYGNNPWLEEAACQMLFINTLDAEARGIGHGDEVLVYNEFGKTLTKARVTPRVMPGVVMLPQGAWHKPGPGGVDQGGSVNILTSQRPSPLAKGNPQHTNMVEVEKAPE